VQELRKGLEGIAGIRVEVEPMTANEKAVGLSQDEIKTDIEDRCRLAGIKVGDDYKSYLFIDIILGDVPCESVTRYEANVIVRFRQMVTIKENGAIVDAATWDDSTICGGFGSGDSDTIRYTVENITDGFIRDYLAANPKR
jgi:hypothetical protein